MKKTILIRTRCGCVRQIDVDENATAWHVPLPKRVRVWNEAPGPFDVEMPVRVFAPEGDHMEWGVGCFEVWDEREERGVVKAEAPIPPFTSGEWGDAIARFRKHVHGDMPMLDFRFKHAHELANSQIIYHEAHDAGERVLVGAFYVAPGWSHSEEAVRLFTRINELRAQGRWPHDDES